MTQLAHSGVMTFLFTDIEGSTRRWEADAEEMRSALAAHDARMRDAIESHDGWLFKHTGDGVCAVFGSPSAAVAASVAAQSVLELPVRMGLATGEAELREGDYFSAVLNRASRVMAAGHGGQILLDGATAGLIGGVDLISLGARRLRDIANPVDLFQVRAPGLRNEFPPLKTETTPGNLRPPTTSLIGREAELADLETALKAHRLVTLIGVGGVGKTRLALEVATRSADSFPDGVWVVELAALGDPAAVPEAVAAVLGIAQQAGLSVAQSVAAALEGRSRLLVFDNCEHVLDAAADMIGSILQHSATVTIVATSREGLRLADEQLWPVPSLEVRNSADSAAPVLFVERAGAVAPGISLAGAGTEELVVEICRRLDGIPLAIELAASRMQSMTAHELRDRLDDRFRLLVGARRGLERHQTLRHAVQWSYDLLDDAEKALLTQCSVFAGGFDLTGACVVTDSDDDLATLDLLDSLVRKSLLVADRSSGHTRFSMLETIRQFGEEQLVATGDAANARAAQARYLAGRESDVLALWDSPRQRDSYDWFDIELPNLRAAFRWAVDHDDIDTAATIATYAAFVGTLVEHYEPLAWAEEIIEPARALQHHRLLALYVTVTQIYLLGRIDDAIEYGEHAQKLTGDGHFDSFPFDYGAYHASPYIAVGRPERWADACRVQLQHDDDSHGYSRASLAMALALSGAVIEAKDALRGVVAIAEATENPHSLSIALLAEGLVNRYVDPATALAALRRSLSIAQESGNRFSESHTAVTLSELEVHYGAQQSAFDHLTLAMRNYQDSGNIATQRSPLAILAGLLHRLGHLEPAAIIAEFADGPLTRMAFSEITTTIAHLREVLGDDVYESFARRGESMTNAAMAAYAFEQIDRARAELRVNAPSGIVTFLFTDIEGSTRRWEADAHAMRVALEAHNLTLREAIEAHAGHVFSYTGDGMCAVFASPRAAVNAAIAAQLELELPVRMGIATGEAEMRGGDYFGTVLNRTARVMAAGHGGQILLDGTTAGLISEVSLISLGPKRLRDIAQPFEIFQVQAQGLGTEFPPLKTLDATLGNLRSPSTSFVGRETELAELEQALKAHELVTLTGVGGVGKTRLALEVGARLAEDFRDGVWVIELASVGDPAAVPDAAAAALGITQQPGMSLADSVAAALEGRLRLLIFDNCEHVLDAAADMIAAILARSDTVKILSTSREGLRIEDEQLWSVSSLETNSGVDSSAASLFADRARTVARDVSLTPHGAVVEICQRLDGIPLAIELAASRLVSMSVTEVRDHLDDRFRLLVGSRRGPEHHQTLRQTVQWSYDLLDDAERALLQRCSVFAGGFGLDGASAVVGSDDDFTTLDLLDSLVRKSLVVADRTSDRTRYSMLETIRQFAEEQLAAVGQIDDARAKHARYFAKQEAAVLTLWDSPRQREAYGWFAVELPNLRAAFRWAADHDDIDSAVAIAFYSAFVGLEVEQLEPIGWAEEALVPAREIDHPRLAQLYSMATTCWETGRTDDALRYSAAGQEAVESGRFEAVPYEAETWLGGVYLWVGRPEQGIEWLRKVIARSPGAHLFARSGLVLALQVAHAGDETTTAAKGLLGAVDATDNPRVASWALLAFGIANQDADPAAAQEALRRGLAIAQDTGNRKSKSAIAATLALLTAEHGDPIDALGFVSVAIRSHHDSGSFSQLRTSLTVLASLFDRLGNYEPATIICEFAVNPMVRAAYPEIDRTIAHLKEVLGDEVYQSLAGAGRGITTAAMVSYAFDQVDQARAELQ